MFNFHDTSAVNDRQATLNLHSYEYAIIIGVGGIGSWIAYNLAMSGQINQVVMYDDDVVEDTNLNRTPFKISHIGMPKVLAMKELILERRPFTNTHSYNKKFTDETAEQLLNKISRREKVKMEYISDYTAKNMIIVDCRDDTFHDLKLINCKAWKVGYNGLELSIDGNPRETVVMGESRGYEVTPSFLLPTQFIANLVVTNILVNKTWFDEDPKYSELNDEYGQFKGILTFNTTDLLYDLHMLYNEKVLECQQDQ